MSKKHHPHHPTKAEIAAREAEVHREHERQRVAAANKARTDAIIAARARSGREMAPQLDLWQREVGAMPVSNEVEISPLKVPMKVISQYDDLRRRPDGTTYPHTAFDGQPATPVANPEVVAMISGKVLFAKEYDPAAGYTVVVGGDNGIYYSYSHLKTISVKVGDRVPQGTTLGIMGNSGNAKDIEGGCIHVAVHAPDEWLKAGGINAVILAGAGDSPYGSEVRGVTLLPHYKRIRPTVNGVELRNGMIVQPGLPAAPVVAPPVVAPIVTLDTATLAGMRGLTTIDPTILPSLDSILPNPIPGILGQSPLIPKLKR